MTPAAAPADPTAAELRACLLRGWNLRMACGERLALGADFAAAVFRVVAEGGGTYFLKLRRAGFAPVAAELPAFLRGKAGIAAVVAPLPARSGRLWLPHGVGGEAVWLLYPFVAGQDAFSRPLAAAQWMALGEAVAAIHAAAPPAELLARLPQEDFSPRHRRAVALYCQSLAAAPATQDDPMAARLAALCRRHQGEIAALLERTGRLAPRLARRDLPRVVCHADLHAGNLLAADDDDTIAIVDWDGATLAPRERDLMFVGAGIGGVWNDAREDELFYRGYGPVAIDRDALDYYRSERILADIAETIAFLQEPGAPEERREEALGLLASQFEPGNVVEIAARRSPE